MVSVTLSSFIRKCGGSALAALILLSSIGCTERTPESSGGPVAMRRLTEVQYRNSIADIFGTDIKIVGQFGANYRRDGLLAVGSAWASISPAGFEQYESMARSIAEQVVTKRAFDELPECQSLADGAAPDQTCTIAFVNHYGRQLLRRPLRKEEIEERIEVANKATQLLEDDTAGLQYALSSLLISPEFLFRAEVAEKDPDDTERLRLTELSKATRLSYLLWNSTPDEELLRAAEHGELHDKKGLARQVDRMLASKRLESGIQAFFSDLLSFDEFDDLSKDTSIYPLYTSDIGEAAKEQTLRTISDHLVARRGDYRELFTLREIPMTRKLGLVYRVPVTKSEGWEYYQFPGTGARAGLLSQVSLLALHSHPGRSSPTLRGKFIRETFLCQSVPPPPANVDFTMDEESELLKTARARLEKHRSNPACAGCHQLMDPIGLTLEKFDGVGAFRAEENGEPIDVSGQLQGNEFAGAPGLGRALYDSPEVPACLVETLYEFAVGRTVVDGERKFINFLSTQFAERGYDVVELLREIATSKAFYTVSKPRSLEKATES